MMWFLSCLAFLHYVSSVHLVGAVAAVATSAV